MGWPRCDISASLLPAVALAAPLYPAPGAPVANPRDILELRGPLPPSGWPPFALTLLLLCGAAALTLAWLWLRRVRQLPDPLPEKNEDPINLLGGLAAWYGAGGAPAELLCLRVAVLLRSTLGRRTGLPAARLTTDEFLGRVRVPELLGADELALADQLLSFCDRVKFARHEPDAAEVRWMMDAAQELLGRQAEESA